MQLLYPFPLLKATFSHGQDQHPLAEEVASRLAERMADMRRGFGTVLDLGSGTASMAASLAQAGVTPDTLIHADLVSGNLHHPLSVALNAEHPLPFANGTFDAVISNLMLHWINDVPQTLMHIGRALKPDGLFLASTFGNDSFIELKTAFAESGSRHAHTIPFTDVQSAGAALQKVGYAMPVVDRDVITVTYKDFAALYTDMRLAGSRNLHPARSRGLMTPRQLRRMEDAYRTNFARPDGTLPVTLEILYLHGWRPHTSQQKPLKPGSATVSLDEVLKTLPPRSQKD